MEINSVLTIPWIEVNKQFASSLLDISMVSCQKGPTRHAYAWQIGPFWRDTIDIAFLKHLRETGQEYEYATIIQYPSPEW